MEVFAWMNYFLDVVLRQSEAAIGLLEAEDIEKLLSPKQLAVWRYIQEAGDVAPLEISRETKIVKPTVIQALNRLVKFKKIERIGMGRATRYRKL
jgi:DNA-binding MarR family transcriptional regulator